MLSGGETSLSSWKFYEGFMSETQISKELTAPFYVCRPHIFLPDALPQSGKVSHVKNLPCHQERAQPKQLQVSLTRGGSTEGKKPKKQKPALYTKGSLSVQPPNAYRLKTNRMPKEEQKTKTLICSSSGEKTTGAPPHWPGWVSSEQPPASPQVSKITFKYPF